MVTLKTPLPFKSDKVSSDKRISSWKNRYFPSRNNCKAKEYPHNKKPKRLPKLREGTLKSRRALLSFTETCLSTTQKSSTKTLSSFMRESERDRTSWWEAGPFWAISLESSLIPEPAIGLASLGPNPARKDWKWKISTHQKGPTHGTELTATAQLASQTIEAHTPNRISLKEALSNLPSLLQTSKEIVQQQVFNRTTRPNWAKSRESSKRSNKFQSRSKWLRLNTEIWV